MCEASSAQRPQQALCQVPVSVTPDARVVLGFFWDVQQRASEEESSRRVLEAC